MSRAGQDGPAGAGVEFLIDPTVGAYIPSPPLPFNDTHGHYSSSSSIITSTVRPVAPTTTETLYADTHYSNLS